MASAADVTHDKTHGDEAIVKADPDRFQEFTMGVKQAYRPEWLDSEN